MLSLLLVAALQTLAPAPADLTALGIVIHASPERSTALLRAGGRTRVVSVGETAFGGRVVAIRREGVTLEFASGRVDLPLRKAADAASPPAPEAIPVREVNDAIEDPVTPHRLMVRTEVERRLGAEIPRILAETALSPVTEEGRVVGLAVTRLADGTLLADAGLRAGDVLTQINDTPIDGMAALISLWPRLQGATELRAVVRRAGRPVLLSVTLR
jgi:type II secretory pathway component PulC